MPEITPHPPLPSLSPPIINLAKPPLKFLILKTLPYFLRFLYPFFFKYTRGILCCIISLYFILDFEKNFLYNKSRKRKVNFILKLIDFINENKEWRTLLAEPPYSFSIKDDGNYSLIKYGFGITDFAAIGKLGLEARGLIVKNCSGFYKEVCHGLNKFFNMEESNAAKLDWEHGFSVLEKMDGTNIRVWCDEGEWHISTLGTIFADNDEYGLLFKKACGDFNNYVKELNPSYTYVYELVGPLNRIVVRYEETAAYFICKRNLNSDLESLNAPEAIRCGVRIIPSYSAKNKWDAIQLRNKLPENVEGMVVCDSHFNRVKLKTDWYLELHRVKGNGICTVKRVVKLWQLEGLDDFIAAFPEYNKFVEPIMNEIRALVNGSEAAFHSLSKEEIPRKVFAAKVQQYAPLVQACCYALLDNKVESAAAFFKTMMTNKLAKYVESRVSVKEFGREEDEG